MWHSGHRAGDDLRGIRNKRNECPLPGRQAAQVGDRKVIKGPSHRGQSPTHSALLSDNNFTSDYSRNRILSLFIIISSARNSICLILASFSLRFHFFSLPFVLLREKKAPNYSIEANFRFFIWFSIVVLATKCLNENRIAPNHLMKNPRAFFRLSLVLSSRSFATWRLVSPFPPALLLFSFE